MSSDNEELATPLKDDLPQLRAHRDVWGHKDLLSNIISRYFIVTGELGGTKWPVWKVDEKSSEIENFGERRISLCLIFPKPLQPCCKLASLIPFHENISIKSATALASNHVRYKPFSTRIGFRFINSNFSIDRLT